MTPRAAVALEPRLAPLVATVQHNCDVSDARHARDGALCTYLLGMRELYRWWSGAPPGATLARGEVGAFVAAREAAWDRLDDSNPAYRMLPVGAGIEAFDETLADALLQPQRLVYGGGVGRFGAPVFFLAERLRESLQDGVQIVYAGIEFARGVVAPPAVSRANRVVVRTDALRRWLWTRVEAGDARGHKHGLAALIDALGTTPHNAIERIVAEHAETLALHEIGELRAGHLLGPDWERMLSALDDRPAEVLARALRDLLADGLVTLPELARRGDDTALRFWFANLEGLRRALAPRLAALGPPQRGAHFDTLVDASAELCAQSLAGSLDLLDRWRRGGAGLVREATRALLAKFQAA